MKSTNPLLALALVCMFTGCVTRKAFYASPYNGLNHSYQTIPLIKDSIGSTVYASLALASGSANDNHGDKVLAASANFSQSRSFGKFQAFYGAGFGIGSYKVDRFDDGDIDNTVNPSIINANAGKKSFSGLGFNGGINYTWSFRHGEWRIVGFETSLRKEFGDYLAFRKALPYSAATLIFKNDFYSTAGGYTELLGRSDQFTYGFKIGIGTVLSKEYQQVNSVFSGYHYRRLMYNYANITLHCSAGKWTGYVQMNDAGKASNIILGSNYRFGK